MDGWIDKCSEASENPIKNIFEQVDYFSASCDLFSFLYFSFSLLFFFEINDITRPNNEACQEGSQEYRSWRTGLFFFTVINVICSYFSCSHLTLHCSVCIVCGPCLGASVFFFLYASFLVSFVSWDYMNLLPLHSLMCVLVSCQSKCEVHWTVEQSWQFQHLLETVRTALRPAGHFWTSLIAQRSVTPYIMLLQCCNAYLFKVNK